MNEPHYRLILTLENRFSVYFDEQEFNTFEEAVSVAKYVAINGYPFGEGKSYNVKTVKVVQETTQITLQGKAYQPET